MANSRDNHPEEESQNHVHYFLKVVTFDQYLIVFRSSIRTFEEKSVPLPPNSQKSNLFTTIIN